MAIESWLMLSLTYVNWCRQRSAENQLQLRQHLSDTGEVGPGWTMSSQPLHPVDHGSYSAFPATRPACTRSHPEGPHADSD